MLRDLRVTASTVCKLVVKYYYYYLLSPTLGARWPLGGPPTLGGHSVGASLQTRNSCPQSSELSLLPVLSKGRWTPGQGRAPDDMRTIEANEKI